MAPILLFVPELRTLAFLFHWAGLRAAEPMYKTLRLICTLLFNYSKNIMVRFCGHR